MIKIDEENLKRKKKIIIFFITVILMCIIIFVSLYISQKSTREWVDVHLFKKNLTENDIQTLSLNTNKTNQIYVYNKYVSILNDKTITLYNSYSEKITEIDVNINSAIFDSNDKYLAIAENQGRELCLIFDKTYLWSVTTDSDILQVHVNRNGYVAVITTDIAHKSILTLYSSEGKKIFTRYFATNRIVDASISKDNKYIAVGELDSSGAIIQSIIEIISVENAQKDSNNTIIYTKNSDTGRLISNVEYQENGNIICIYDDGISCIKNNNDIDVLKIENDKITYVSSKLNNCVVYVEEQAERLFKVNSNINIVNTTNEQKSLYNLDDVVKEIYISENIIAINTGTDIHFINSNGWLIKKYTANQEITNVKISDNLAVIIYKDKIEMIDL